MKGECDIEGGGLTVSEPAEGVNGQSQVLDSWKARKRT